MSPYVVVGTPPGAFQGTISKVQILTGDRDYDGDLGGIPVLLQILYKSTRGTGDCAPISGLLLTPSHLVCHVCNCESPC